MVAEQLNAPVPEVVAPHDVIEAPVAIVVVIVTPGVNPLPETVVVAPLGPWAGVRVMLVVVTVNVAVDLSNAPSDPVAVTVYAAGVLEVIATVQLNVPVAATVAPQAPIVAPLPMLDATVAPGVNPVPEIVVEAPLGPRVGASEIAGCVTVKAAVALSNEPSEPVAVTV
jgi:hypothetical protein